MSDDETHVLLIEDDHVDVVLTRRALQQCRGNYHLVNCRSLAEAIKILDRRSFDAVLLDLSLPDSFGIAGLRRLLRAAPETPFVVLTGLADDQWARSALEAGAQDYLLKGKASKDLLERTLRYAIQRQQITCENRQLMDELRRLARVDALTGTLNRQAFADVLEAEWQRAGRHARPLSCVMLDIDFFKQINDNYGHAAGDAALKSVANLLHEQGRNEDFVARYGGEEFCILLPDTPEEATAAWAERLREILAQQAIETSAGTIQLTASFGVATRQESLTHGDDLLEHADQALFLAKQMGRNQVITFGHMQRLLDSRLNELAVRFEGVQAIEMMLPLSLTVEGDRPIRDVITAMLHNQIDVAAVIDDHGHLIGRIAESDLVSQLFAMANDNLAAADVMQKPIGCFSAETPMPRICEFFSRAGCGRVFVVDEQRPVGVITAGRVLRWLSELHVDTPDRQEEVTLASLLGEIQRETYQLHKLLESESPTAAPETLGKASLLAQLVDLSVAQLTRA